MSKVDGCHFSVELKPFHFWAVSNVLAGFSGRPSFSAPPTLIEIVASDGLAGADAATVFDERADGAAQIREFLGHLGT